MHSYQTGDKTTSTPCVAPDGSVFIGSYDNNLYKLDAQLKLVWKFATSGQVWSSPARPAAKTASRSVRRALLTLQVSPGHTLSLQ